MPQLVARIDASGKEIRLALMPVGKEATGSEKLLASRLVKSAAADPAIPVTGVVASSSKTSEATRK